LKRIKILDRNGAGFGEKPQPKKTRHYSVIRAPKGEWEAICLAGWSDDQVIGQSGDSHGPRRAAKTNGVSRLLPESPKLWRKFSPQRIYCQEESF